MAKSVSELLDVFGARYADVRHIGVYSGPGSFTGIRIAMAAALGIARATGANAYGLDGFTRLAYCAKDAGVFPLVACIGAGRGNIYVATVDHCFAPQRPLVISVEDFPEYVTASGLDSASPILADGRGRDALENIGVDARCVAASGYASMTAFKELRESGRFDGETLAPFYVRPPDAKPQSPFVPGGDLAYN